MLVQRNKLHKNTDEWKTFKLKDRQLNDEIFDVDYGGEAVRLMEKFLEGRLNANKYGTSEFVQLINNGQLLEYSYYSTLSMWQYLREIVDNIKSNWEEEEVKKPDFWQDHASGLHRTAKNEFFSWCNIPAN